MKTIKIIGSTGSIGIQALDIISKFQNEFKVVALTGWENIGLLAKQIAKFKPTHIAVKSKEIAENIKNKFLNVKVSYGESGINEIAKIPTDITLVATVGISGLLPVVYAIESSNTLCLANKESIVVAGEIIIDLAKKHNTSIIPVDSEHSAIFQCLQGEDKENINRIILTASGGPFLRYSKDELKNVTPKDALFHPTWHMGKKITVDSATLMNKGFEVIEAMHLFGVSLSKIEVVIHPQSIVHSIIEFCDGSIKAQLSYPDMRLPIQYALFYPERKDKKFIKDIDFSNLNLSFEKVPQGKFPCLALARYSAKKGGSAPCVLQAADEVAVELFLREKIKFVDIPKIIEKELLSHKIIKNPTIDEIVEIDKEVKARIYENMVNNNLLRFLE